MSLKRFGVAMAAAAMLAAIVASSASAASVTEESHWYVAGNALAAGATKEVTCAVGKHNGEEKLVLTGHLGEGLTPVKLTATAIDCTRHEGELGGNSLIEQVGNSAQDRGRLTFTHVTVSEPANCKIEPLNGAAAETVITNPLKTELYMDSANTAITFDKFEPTAAYNGVFAEVKIGKSGTAACAVSGTYKAKGTSFGEAVKPAAVSESEATVTGTVATPNEVATQGLTFSGAIEETAGGTLTLGGNAATITGRVNNTLVGGAVWGARRN